MSASPPVKHGVRAALCLVLVGIFAALHVWKLPPALPVLQAELGIDLVQSGFLVSVIQLGGMTLGLLVGLMAERLGLRRCIMSGLVILTAASVVGAQLHTVSAMLLLRGVEGCGFLMAVMPIPSLIRRLVPPQMLSRIMGLWSCYIPVGTILILIFGSWMLSVSTWRFLWLLLALFTLGAMLLVWIAVPGDPPRRRAAYVAAGRPAHAGVGAPLDGAARSVQTVSLPALALVRQTLGALPVWLVALTFGMYSAQWMAIVGFLPTVYTAAGIGGTTAGMLTGLVAGANIIGNLLAGQLLHRQVAPRQLLVLGFVTMIVCAYLAFGAGLSMTGQFIAVLILSAVGGLIPATMFVLALAVAPSAQATTTTVGWMQQGTSLGQFCGPPVVAWVVSLAGGWHYAWIATAAFSIVGILLALALERSMSSSRAPAAYSPL